MKKESENDEQTFSRKVGEKEKRKLKFLHSRNRKSVWSGMGLIGIVGWTVVIPSLAGTALGIWLDKRYPHAFSFTITLLLAGLITGCVAAWRWVAKEDKEINKNHNEDE